MKEGIVIILTLLIIMVAMPLCNKWLPVWFCKNFGYWHLKPKQVGFDGCSNTGVCPRCGKNVLQDSQGNWF